MRESQNAERADDVSLARDLPDETLYRRSDLIYLTAEARK